MKASDIPNLITAFRFLLVPPVVLSLLNDRFGTALILFFIAGFSDALDGYLAKRNNWTSRIGALMDPLADKLLLVSCFVTLGWLGWIPVWLVALVVLRDLVIIGGAAGISRIGASAVESMARQPEAAGQINTAMIITAALIEGATLFAVVVTLLAVF